MDKLGVLVSGFIMILVGVIFTGIIADNIYDNTQLGTLTNESYEGITAGTNFTLNYDDLASQPYAHNDTNSSINITVVSNTTATVFARMGGHMNISYTYYPDTYIKQNATARTMINLTTIFFALAIVAFGLFLIVKGGLLDLFRK
jgi:hypothetical protein